MKTESPIKRRRSRQIMVGNVPVGGDAPISVQSMTNTETCDVAYVDEATFLKLYYQDPSFGLYVMKLATRRLLVAARC